MNRREFIFGGIAALASLFVLKSPRDKEPESFIGETELTVTTNDALTYDELEKSVNQFYALNGRVPQFMPYWGISAEQIRKKIEELRLEVSIGYFADVKYQDGIGYVKNIEPIGYSSITTKIEQVAQQIEEDTNLIDVLPNFRCVSCEKYDFNHCRDYDSGYAIDCELCNDSENVVDSEIVMARLERLAKSLSNVSESAKDTSKTFDEFVQAAVRSTQTVQDHHEQSLGLLPS